MSKLSRTQSLVLAAAARWPLNYVVWADGFVQAHLELPNGLQVVKTPTVRGLLERGLLARLKEEDDHLKVTLAGHEALAAAPMVVAEVSTPGWRLTTTQERRVGFTVGETNFIVITSGWPNSTSADIMAQRIAHSLIALHARTPDRYKRELARFNAEVQGAFAAIAEEAFDVVSLLYPEVEGYANNATLQISKRR